MGGVDKHDWLVSKYSTSIRGKKWYWPFFTRIIDMAVVNAWIIYKFVNSNKNDVMNLLTFKRSICLAYVKLNGEKPSVGRKCSAAGPSAVQDDIRFDMRGHMIHKRGQQRRCQNKPYHAKPKTYCPKCNVTLCLQCFAPFHKK
uniref:PiggyBac transposable element-derived protein 3-like isoform X1 n=1 Tax=Hirondellea gigas TaxID=1518452 RepID=A0A6A7G6I3_9CRUS